MRFSLLAVFLMTIYAAICSTIFVYANLWFGTIVVMATVVLLAVTTARAANTQHRFLLSFSIAGWGWLVLCLGFYAQTDKKTPDWTTPHTIYSISEAIRHPALDAGDGEAKMHSLHVTGGMIKHNTAPSFHNLIRFAACVSALLAGFAAGALHYIVGRTK